MKIAFTTSGDELSAPLDSRFGRAPKFLLYDLDDNSFQIIDNTQILNTSQGAGIQSAEKIAQHGVKAVVTGHCGPKAFQVLSVAGIEIYTSKAASVIEALEAYKKGKLCKLNSADSDGH